MKDNSKNNGLWSETFGAVGASLKELEDRGVTPEHLKLIRSDSDVADAVANAVKEAYNKRYLDEIVPSSFGYPPEFKESYPEGYRPIDEQIEDLASRFNLNGKKALEFAHKAFVGKKKPEGMEGPFAFVYSPALGENYEKAMVAILDEVKKVHPTFFNYIKDKMESKYHRETAHKHDSVEALHDIIGCDILVSWGQLGLQFAGHSSRCARVKMEQDEFGAGVVEGGSVIITHPKRLVRYDQLHMDLSGDERSPGGGDSFGYAPYLCPHDDKVGLHSNWTGYAYRQWGSVSFHPPQS